MKNPHRILPFIRDNTIPHFLSTYGKIYERINSIDDQRRLIHQYIEQNDEFVLVVLDACRFDTFESAISDYLTGEIDKAWSPGSLTPQWGPQVWTEDYDLTYISSNPIIGDFEYSPRNSDFGYNTFCAADHVERFVDAYNFAWDDDVESVYPSDMTDIALEEAARDEPTRLVVHYLQPHLPFIGEKGFSHYVLDHKSRSFSINYSDQEREMFLENNTEITLEQALKYDVTWSDELQYGLQITNSEGRGYRALLREGVVTNEDIQRGYVDNLEIALKQIRRLARCVDCPVVITADHGEFLGEYGQYDHPDVLHPILREVPWFEVDKSEIGVEKNSFDPVEREHKSIDDEGVRGRLSDLGYL